MVVLGRLERHSSIDQALLVYKIDKFCTEFSIKFSCVNPIQGSSFVQH